MAVVSIGGRSASGASSTSKVPSDGSLAISLSGASVGPIAQEADGVQDILQQALEEASHNDFSQGTNGTYEGQNSMVTTTNDSETVVPCGDPEIGMTCLRIVDPERLVLGEHESAYTYFTETGETLQTFSNIQPYTYATNASNAYQETGSSPNILPDLLGDQSQFVNGIEAPNTDNLISEDAITSNLTRESLVHSSVPPKFTFLTTASATTTQFKHNAKKMAPLGSSDNPIRIIQQGNQYKSLQNLSPEQLAQIMQVVQQQQLIRSSQQTGQASILYNPQTQTKIVFKVVYPSELHKNVSLTTTPSMTINGSQMEGSKNGNLTLSQKKLYHKRKHLNEEKGNSPEFSRQEKELRKKHRQRTRYGRVSRPPQYMVKDYKHIHPVDYDEDYDDSDGGYSDFKEGSSEEDGNGTQKTKNADHISFGQAGLLGIGKPRKHKCNTCEKGYIGLGGLARHYRLNPTHGSLTETGTDACNSSDSFQSVSTTPCSTQPLVTTFADAIVSASASVQSSSSSSSNGHLMTSSDVVGELPEVTDVPPVSSGNPLSACDDQEQSNSSPVSKDLTDITDHHSSSSTPLLSHPSKRGKRGRPPSTQQAERRKERLQELVRHCTDEELMEVVMPRLSASVNLWEFLLMKTERKGARPDLSEMIKEFEDFRKQIATMFRTKLVPISTDASSMAAATDEQKMETDKSVDELEILSADCHVKPKAKTSKSIIEISDSDIAHCLGLSSGRYEVRDEEPLRQYKLLTSNPALVHQNPSQTAIRTVELVSQDQLIALPLRKRLRLTENIHGYAPSCTLANSSTGSDYGWKSLNSSVSSSNGTCKQEVHNGELAKTTDGLRASHVSHENEAVSGDNESVRQPSVNDSLIEFISSSQAMESCHLSGSPLTAEHPVNSPVLAMIDGNHHLLKSEGNGILSPDCKLSFVSANHSSLTLASNDSLHCVSTEPSSQVLHLIGGSGSSSDIMTSACLTVSQFCNGNLNDIGSFTDGRTSSASTIPANCLSTTNFSADELQSLFVVKSESDRKSCHSAEPSLMETGLYAVNSNADIIAMTNGTLCQSTLEHEHDSTVTDRQTGHVLQFISNNVEEPASSSNDFISSPIQDFVGNVDDKLQSQQGLLIQDCELGEYGGSHQEIQLDENAQVVQTSDGLIVIRHPDGSIQIHGQPGQQIPFETVQALFGLEPDNQIMFADVQQT